MPPASPRATATSRPWTEMTERDHYAIANYVITRGCGLYEAFEAHGWHDPKKPLNHREELPDERWYFITLTQPANDKKWERILKATRKILFSKQIAPTEWMFVKELTEDLTPHVHIRLQTIKYINIGVIRQFNDNYRIDCQRERGGCYDYLRDNTKKHPDGEWFFCSENYSGPRPDVVPNAVPDEVLNADENELILNP